MDRRRKGRGHARPSHRPGGGMDGGREVTKLEIPMKRAEMRMHAIPLLSVAFVAAIAGTAAGAQTTLPDSLAPRIDAVFARYNSTTPGCAVGVFQNGKVALAKGYGLANLEHDVPITPRTPFIMGSVSKQFTAAAIALLVEQGRISLSDDVRKYIPELHDYGKRVTVDHLVHHTSGLRDFWALVDAAGMRPDDGYTVDDVLALAAR